MKLLLLFRITALLVVSENLEFSVCHLYSIQVERKCLEENSMLNTKYIKLPTSIKHFTMKYDFFPCLRNFNAIEISGFLTQNQFIQSSYIKSKAFSGLCCSMLQLRTAYLKTSAAERVGNSLTLKSNNIWKG